MIRRGVQGLFLPGPSVVGGVDTPAILCRRRRHEWGGGPKDEARLARRQQLAAGGEWAERGARGFAGQRAETLAAEVAIIAGCFGWHAEDSL